MMTDEEIIDMIAEVGIDGEVIFVTKDDHQTRRDWADLALGDGALKSVEADGPLHSNISKLPNERMAGAVPLPTSAEMAEVRGLDPQRAERWEPVQTSVLNGWRFQLEPYPGMVFKFLAFRNPSDGNLFRIWVISPDRDDPRWQGHNNHMIKVTIGGERIAVLCGPGGRAAPSLTQARLFAAKWAVYTARVMRGEPVKFSS